MQPGSWFVRGRGKCMIAKWRSRICRTRKYTTEKFMDWMCFLHREYHLIVFDNLIASAYFNSLPAMSTNNNNNNNARHCQLTCRTYDHPIFWLLAFLVLTSGIFTTWGIKKIIIIIIVIPELWTLFPNSAAEIVFTQEMRERLRTYSNAFLSCYIASTPCFCTTLSASWPAGPMTIRHFDFSFFSF